MSSTSRASWMRDMRHLAGWDVGQAPYGRKRARLFDICLADPVRIRLLSLLLAADEVCTCDLAPPLGVTEATVSHHLSVLRRAGLVDDGERRGMNVYYR